MNNLSSLNHKYRNLPSLEDLTLIHHGLEAKNGDGGLEKQAANEENATVSAGSPELTSAKPIMYGQELPEVNNCQIIFTVKITPLFQFSGPLQSPPLLLSLGDHFVLGNLPSNRRTLLLHEVNNFALTGPSKVFGFTGFFLFQEQQQSRAPLEYVAVHGCPR